MWSTSGVAFWDPANERWRAVPHHRRLDRSALLGWRWRLDGFERRLLGQRPRVRRRRMTRGSRSRPPRVSIQGVVAFDGHELIVVGFASEQIPQATAEMAFDPASNTWRNASDIGVRRAGARPRSVGRSAGIRRPKSILGVDYQNNAAVYDAQPTHGLRSNRCQSIPARTRGRSWLMDGGRAFVTSTWTGQAFARTRTASGRSFREVPVAFEPRARVPDRRASRSYVP